jgi:phage terminase small subunit
VEKAKVPTLSRRHQRFVAEYSIDWNATAAYKRADYHARGHAAEVNASRLAHRPAIAAAAAALLAQQIEAARDAYRRMSGNY